MELVLPKSNLPNYIRADSGITKVIVNKTKVLENQSHLVEVVKFLQKLLILTNFVVSI